MNNLSLSEFTRHFFSPDHQSQLSQVDCQAQDNEGRKIYLQIDKEQNRILQVGFDLPLEDAWTPYFSMLNSCLKGQVVSEAMSFGWQELHSSIHGQKPQTAEESAVQKVFLKKFAQGELPIGFLPGILYKKATEHFLGLDHFAPKGNSPLICRCFGVNRNKLEELFKNGPDLLPQAVSGKINAGAGCGTCRDDIELIWSEYCIEPIEVHINNGRHIGACKGIGIHTPVECATLTTSYLDANWPGAKLKRCAGKRIEILAPLSVYQNMLNNLENIQRDLESEFGASFVLLLRTC